MKYVKVKKKSRYIHCLRILELQRILFPSSFKLQSYTFTKIFVCNATVMMMIIKKTNHKPHLFIQ